MKNKLPNNHRNEFEEYKKWLFGLLYIILTSVIWVPALLILFSAPCLLVYTLIYRPEENWGVVVGISSVVSLVAWAIFWNAFLSDIIFNWKMRREERRINFGTICNTDEEQV